MVKAIKTKNSCGRTDSAFRNCSKTSINNSQIDLKAVISSLAETSCQVQAKAIRLTR